MLRLQGGDYLTDDFIIGVFKMGPTCHYCVVSHKVHVYDIVPFFKRVYLSH